MGKAQTSAKMRFRSLEVNIKLIYKYEKGKLLITLAPNSKNLIIHAFRCNRPKMDTQRMRILLKASTHTILWGTRACF